jgi:AcrR family transcriptional regulator
MIDQGIGASMPTPERTSLEAIVGAGRALLETDGVEGLTMQAVAERVGVRAPSLYKRVRNRDELIARIAEDTLRELSARLDDAAERTRPADPGLELAHLARTVRAFAHERPAGYRLIFGPGAELRLSDAALADASGAVLRIAGELAGDEHRLDAARTITAWVNGFVSMELAGAFRLGGDIDRAFEFGIACLTDALTLRPMAASGTPLAISVSGH